MERKFRSAVPRDHSSAGLPTPLVSADEIASAVHRSCDRNFGSLIQNLGTTDAHLSYAGWTDGHFSLARASAVLASAQNE